MTTSYLRFKAGVIVPKVVIIAAAFINACNQIGLTGDQTVTSGNDSSHARNSAHYTDEALDFRTKHLCSADKHKLRDAVIRRLGVGYTVLLEDEGEVNEHLHVQVSRAVRQPA